MKHRMAGVVASVGRTHSCLTTLLITLSCALATPAQAQNDKMTALATAQVYFDRPNALFPRNADTRRELGNLFSPYWQARLVDTPKSVKAEIFGADMVGV